jgi:hypothetical protein
VLPVVFVALAGCYASGAGDVPRVDGGAAPHTMPPSVDAGPIAVPSICTAPPRGDRAGDVWDGYIEGWMSLEGVDQVHIVFDSATGDGPRTGVVVFGTGTAPPQATDPTVGYPLGIDWRSGSGSRAGFVRTFPSLGVEYPIRAGSVEGARVRVTVDLDSLWDCWCAMQTPYPQGPSASGFGCTPNTGGHGDASGCWYNDPAGGPPIMADCGWISLCGASGPSVCTCSETACTSSDAYPIDFDFHVSGSEGTGTVDLTGAFTVRLTR